MTEDGSRAAAPQRHGTATRGFLFADLRGYTAFVERHGAHRAAAMLDRYRTLVRAAVADFDGAEIRTEGDSFYVVFDSASAAIECGLAIVNGAEEAAGADPATTFQVGVGIHAGETVETAEGYVGSAVNTAARICAQAGPNQVLVSGTVRALTSGVVGASFVPIGRRRLKGLSDPIELYRAMGQTASVPARAILPAGKLGVALAGFGALVLIALAVVMIVRPNLGATSGDPTGASASGALALEGPASPVSAEPSVAASGLADEFPNEVETELLALIPESDRDRCERPSESDLPVLDSVSISGVPPVTRSYRQQISIHGGIHCRLGGINAPDSVWYWRIGFRAEGAEWIAQQAPKVGAVSGSCASEEAAVERWSFGDGSGSLLCNTTVTGDAVLNWTYDQTNVFGRAIRDDRDTVALLDWWSEEARFLAE